MLKQRLKALPQDEKLWKKLMCKIIRLTCVKKTGLFYGMFWNNDRGITKHTLGEVIESFNHWYLACVWKRGG